MLIKWEVASYTVRERSQSTYHGRAYKGLCIQTSWSRYNAAISLCQTEGLTDTDIDSEDTEVHAQAVYVSHQIRCDLLLKRKDCTVSCHAMLSDDDAFVINPLHVITGCDHASSFYVQGKKKLLQKVINNSCARDHFEELVRVWTDRMKWKTTWKHLSLQRSLMRVHIIMWPCKSFQVE